MKLRLHTISPVHIGTGVELEPFEYIVEEKKFYRLSQEKAFKMAQEKHADFAHKFDRWLNNKIERLRSKDTKESAKARAKFNFLDFCRFTLNDDELAEEILKKAYSYKCDSPFDLTSKKKISEVIKTPVNDLFIPGSSIKGSIRTMLGWNALKSINENRIIQSIDDSLKKDANARKGKYLDNLLESEIFICGKEKNGKIDFNDIKFDIMKFIRISDAHADIAEMSVLPAYLYLNNSDPQTQVNGMEVIDFNSSFEFEISVNEDEIRKINEVSMSNNRNNRKWVDFSKKFKYIFGFYVQDIQNGKLEEEIVNSIFNISKEFSKNQIERALNWVDKFDKSKVTGIIKSRYDISYLEDFFNEAKDEFEYMIKIGWGSGFTSTTFFDALHDNKKLELILNRIIEHYKIGVSPKKKNAKNISAPNLSNFPKSIRATAEDLKDAKDPFGWMLLCRENEFYNFGE